jgi:hypothetical protein
VGAYAGANAYTGHSTRQVVSAAGCEAYAAHSDKGSDVANSAGRGTATSLGVAMQSCTTLVLE